MERERAPLLKSATPAEPASWRKHTTHSKSSLLSDRELTLKPITLNVRHYVCVNEDCRQEMDFVATPQSRECRPLCTCGAAMKREYSKPQFREFTSEPELLRLFADALPKHRAAR